MHLFYRFLCRNATFICRAANTTKKNAVAEDNLENDSELAALNKQKPLVVNFNFESKQEDIQVLTALRNLLSKKPYGWCFPRFEVALYLYGQRIGEDVSSPEDTGYLAQSGLKPVVDVATELPVVGRIWKVFLYSYIKNRLKSGLSKEMELLAIFIYASDGENR